MQCRRHVIVLADSWYKLIQHSPPNYSKCYKFLTAQQSIYQNRDVFDEATTLIILPINEGKHWTMAWLNFADSELGFYDPLKSSAARMRTEFEPIILQLVQLAANDVKRSAMVRQRFSEFAKRITRVTNPDWAVQQAFGTLDCGPCCLLTMLQLTLPPPTLPRPSKAQIMFPFLAALLRRNILNILYRGMLDKLFELPTILS
jgi:hypothetical protein